MNTFKNEITESPVPTRKSVNNALDLIEKILVEGDNKEWVKEMRKDFLSIFKN